MKEGSLLKICLLISFIIHLLLIKGVPLNLPSLKKKAPLEVYLKTYPSSKGNKISKTETNSKKRVSNKKNHKAMSESKKKKYQVKNKKPHQESLPKAKTNPKSLISTTASEESSKEVSFKPKNLVSSLVPKKTKVFSHSTKSNSDDSLNDYLHKLRLLIEKNKEYPFGARKRGLEGKVVLEFTLNIKGELVSLKIKRSSGYAILDKAAIKAVKNATPFPPLPQEICSRQILINLPVCFCLLE
ncbi:MAG: hypothetical protein KIIPBIDF_01891 [Candidatus Methanoperedenaceae archaeon GB50]|nr:hypothetical protein BLFGPEAP_01680 [Candidatus Methanoperedenaceae archaeon GB50]CAD7783003.1 MAG: hypothetical protein KIIPBIDF_01891 [Candidatus Methanoperedenaceae archaeon GB50]